MRGSSRRVDQSITVYPQGRFKADSAHVLVEAAAAGIGIVAMGELVAEPYVAAGALVPLMPDYQLPPVGIYVVRPSGQKLARKVKVLIDLVAREFASAKRSTLWRNPSAGSCLAAWVLVGVRPSDTRARHRSGSPDR